MITKRNKHYITILLACAAGYLWLFQNLYSTPASSEQNGVCFIRHVAHIPCPSCGSTRSLVSIVHGNFLTALELNPIGYLIAIIMIFAPLWILIDVITRSETCFKFYIKMEGIIRKPKYAFPLLLLVMINWVWNITKGL